MNDKFLLIKKTGAGIGDRSEISFKRKDVRLPVSHTVC